MLPTQGLRVRTLVGQPRSHMLHGAAKLNKETNKQKIALPLPHVGRPVGSWMLQPEAQRRCQSWDLNLGLGELTGERV